MWGRIAIVALLAATAPGVALAQEQYICIGEKATGFKWNGTEWTPTTFNVDDDKFLVQEISPLKLGEQPVKLPYAFEVKRFGKNEIYLTCEHFKLGNLSRLYCGGVVNGMIIDTNSLRYQEFYGVGYLDGTDNKGTPNVTIGKCSRVK
jgi:hypothetical protein